MDLGTNKADLMVATNRGVTLYKNFVISVTGDCEVLWTKADTGEQVRTVQFDDPKKTHCTLTSAPLLIDDKLIVGGSGGDQGVRAHIDALNADTGERLWRTYSVPASGEPGSATWKGDTNAWEHGGGSFWVTGSERRVIDTHITILLPIPSTYMSPSGLNLCLGDGCGIANGPVIDGPISGEVGSAACSIACCSLAGGVVASSAPAEAAPSRSNAQGRAVSDRIFNVDVFTGFTVAKVLPSRRAPCSGPRDGRLP